MIKSVDTPHISKEEALSRIKEGEANLLKAKERLDYLTRKTYLIQISFNDKKYFLCDDDSLMLRFGDALKFKRKCDAEQELMLWLERTESVGNPNVKSEIVIERSCLEILSHTLKNKLTNNPPSISGSANY